MEIFLLLILILLAFWNVSRQSNANQAMQHRLDQLREDLKALKAQLSIATMRSPETPAQPLGKEATTTEPIPPVKAQEPRLDSPVPPSVVLPPVSAPTPVEPPQMVPQPREFKPEPTLEERLAAAHGQLREKAVSTPTAPKAPQPSFLETFLKNNPDLEKFIGENLINKIGIAILVLGIGYFVKYAIDQEWINEIGRVFIGILAGGLLIGVAHRLRKSFSAFSSVLVGGGLVVLYFTIAIAFHEYQIFSQPAAFLLMVVITAFSILLAISYNRIELAVLSLIGGFATPFMLSTGEGNYQVLFTYILILNVGMLVLAYFKKWNLINIIAYVFTLLLYGGWLSAKVIGVKEAPYLGALVFGTLFYLIFLVMNLINNVKENAKFTASEITILLSNTFLYYSAGMSILAYLGGGAYQGLFTVLVALINFTLAFFLYRSSKVDRNLIYLLIGLVITFISLAIPVQLEGNYITMFWALEAVLLLWFAQQSGLRLVATSSVIVTGLMLISLVMDWAQLYGETLLFTTNQIPLPILLNKAFVTSVLAIVSLAATSWLLTKQAEPFDWRLFRLAVAPYRAAIGFILGLVLYLALLFEYNYQLNVLVESAANRTVLLGGYNLLYVLGLLWYARRTDQRFLQMFSWGLGVFGIFLYLVHYNNAVMDVLRNRYVFGEDFFIGFPFHYLNLLLVIALLWMLSKSTFVALRIPAAITRFFPWALCFVIVYVANSELFFHVVYVHFAGTDLTTLLTPGAQNAANERFENLLTQTNKVGLPILWGICAFIFIFIGLNRKSKDLRIISLSLFTLTLLKLFIYDIRGISEGGKIAAFISLGVLLLVISFMYQNLKKLILADDPTPPSSIE